MAESTAKAAEARSSAISPAIVEFAWEVAKFWRGLPVKSADTLDLAVRRVVEMEAEAGTERPVALDGLKAGALGSATLYLRVPDVEAVEATIRGDGVGFRRINSNGRPPAEELPLWETH